MEPHEPSKLASWARNMNVRRACKACPAIVLAVVAFLLASTMHDCRHAPRPGPATDSSHALRASRDVAMFDAGEDAVEISSIPPWVAWYPSTRQAPCRSGRERAAWTPLECFRVNGKVVGFVDPHARASTFNSMEAWTAQRINDCVHVDALVVRFVVFASEHMPAAIASLPNPPLVVAVDHSGEVGELDHANCIFNELRKNMSETRFIFVNQAASLHNPGQRCFNQHWLIPRELARLEEKAAGAGPFADAAAAADTLDQSGVNLGRSRLICLGGYPRPHKVQIMGEMDASGILDRMLWSGGTPAKWLESNMNSTLEAQGYTPEEMLKAQLFLRKLPHVLDVDRGAKKAGGMSYRSSLYSLADVHLVIESNNRMPSLDRHACSRTFRYTEKTLKAMYAGARFVVFGDPASLELLRAHGFRTFHPHINETYDAIATYRGKVEAIKLELERLLSMSEAEFRAFLAVTQSIVDYNQRWMISDGFMARVYRQSLYAFGLSETPGFALSGYERALERMYASINITDCKSSL